MAEIKLIKRCKYAGEVYLALIEKCGFSPKEASDFLYSIPDVDIEEEYERIRKVDE